MAATDMPGEAAADGQPSGAGAVPCLGGAAKPAVAPPNGTAPAPAELSGGSNKLGAGLAAAGKPAGWAGGRCSHFATCTLSGG